MHNYSCVSHLNLTYISLCLIHGFLVSKSIKQLPKSRHCGVNAHQRQGKRQEGKRSEKGKESKVIEAQMVKLPTPSRTNR